MNQKISKRLSDLDLSLDQIMEEIGGRDSQLLNVNPSDGAWSVNQILNHMLLVEHFTLAYCKKKIHAKNLTKQTVMSKLRLWTLQAYIKSPLKFKAPKGVGTASLPQTDSLSNIKEKWLAQRVELREFLGELSEEQLQLAVYKHPAAGRFTFNDMIIFLKAHSEIHKKQINRTLKAVSDKS